MNKTESPTKNRKTKNNKKEQTRLMNAILEGIFQKKGENILSINLTKIPEAVSDYFIIAEATSPLQVRAIADSVEDVVLNQTGERPYHVEGRQHANWIIIDYIEFVVHIMLPQIRNFYQLEELWSDAPINNHVDN